MWPFRSALIRTCDRHDSRQAAYFFPHLPSLEDKKAKSALPKKAKKKFSASFLHGRPLSRALTPRPPLDRPCPPGTRPRDDVIDVIKTEWILFALKTAPRIEIGPIYFGFVSMNKRWCRNLSPPHYKCIPDIRPILVHCIRCLVQGRRHSNISSSDVCTFNSSDAPATALLQRPLCLLWSRPLSSAMIFLSCASLSLALSLSNSFSYLSLVSLSLSYALFSLSLFLSLSLSPLSLSLFVCLFLSFSLSLSLSVCLSSLSLVSGYLSLSLLFLYSLTLLVVL